MSFRDILPSGLPARLVLPAPDAGTAARSRLLYAGISDIPAGRGGKRYKDHATLHLLVRGTATAGRGARKRLLEPGGLYLYLPYTEKRLVAGPRGSCRWLWLGFDGPDLGDLLAAHGLETGPLPPAPALYEVADCMVRIFAELHRPQVGGATEVEARLTLVINALLRCTGTIPPETVTDGRHPAIAAALRLIAAGQGAALGVSGLAAGVRLERSYFSRLFTAQTGMTPSQAVARTRLERAGQLLRRPELTLTQVAELSGFDDYLGFYRFIRQASGRSPGVYRAALRGSGGNPDSTG